MTNLSPVAPGTGLSVPVASNAQSSDDKTVAALQQLTAAVASLSQAQGMQFPFPPFPSLTIFLSIAAQAAASGAQPLGSDISPDGATPAPASPNATAAATPAAAPTGFLTHGPWLVGGLYIVVPTSPLMAIVEEDAEDKLWYCITQGKFVGVTTSNTLALRAVSRVSGSSMAGHKTQALAVQEFNQMLGYSMVAIPP
ncbi:hypothetical protein C8R43DRAFT_945304 [Mycena crocata]|nr:hypothetical protein C8R43DRAFT_945304 [Mycena crocata]